MAKKKNIVVLDGTLSKVSRNSRTEETMAVRMQRISLRVGLLALCAIALFFAAGGIANIVQSLSEANEQTTMAGVQGLSSEFGERDTLTILIIKENDARSDIEYCTLVRFDPAEGRVLAAPVPVELFVSGKTLRGQYAIGGEAQCALVLGELLESGKIYYTAVTYNKLRDLLNRFGGVTMDLKFAINYKAEDKKRSINAAAGKRKFGGGEVARLLDFPDWPGGEPERMMMFTRVWATLIDEQLNINNSLKLPEMYGKVYNNSYSNVSTGAFQAAEDGLAALADLNGGGGLMLVFDDIWPEDDGDGRLVYSDNGLARMRLLFGTRG